MELDRLIRIQRQQGVALLSVLLILVLLSTMVIYTAENESLGIRRVSNIIEYDQNFQIVMGGEQWGIKLLEQDLQADNLKQQNSFDHRSEKWGNLGPPVSVEGSESTMLVEIIDAQSKFNINNILQGRPIKHNADISEEEREKLPPSYWYSGLKHIFNILSVDAALVDVIYDWIDSDEETTGLSGAEDLYYLGLQPPYRAANQPLHSIGELKLLRGFSTDVIEKIRPYISVLPVDVENNVYPKININTAPSTVLSALGLDEALPSDVFTLMLERRATIPFETVTQFQEELNTLVSSADLHPQHALMLDVNSEHYYIHSCAKTGRIELSLESQARGYPDQENVKVTGRQRFIGCPSLNIKNTAN